MLDNANGVLISGQTVTLVAGNQNVGAESPVAKGMKLLLSRVAVGALHNSGERFDPAKCHPNTRVAIQAEILAWVDDMESRYHTLWMRGAAGAGKSAIAQMIAQSCYEKGQLCASFFFSRTSETGRNNEKQLIATLAYQLSQNIPETESLIGAAVSRNRLIFDLSLETQMETLIIQPLSTVSKAASKKTKPMLILIDGLDECAKMDVQDRVVNIFLSALSCIQHQLPHKLFITSRPEHNITSTFENHSYSAFVRQLPLDDSCNPDEDIRTFLRDSFAGIVRTHHFFKSDRKMRWPPATDIETLIKKSSGQFIYSAVVINYIKSNDNFNPMERLKVILGLKDTTDRPYADLDNLYRYIFAQVKDLDLALKILSVERLSVSLELVDTVYVAMKVLSISAEEVEFTLRALTSILSASSTQIHYLHASLPDFLADETRSESLCITSTRICIDLACRCMNINVVRSSKKSSMIKFCVASTLHFLKNLTTAERIPICEAISKNPDIINVLLDVPIGLLDSKKMGMFLQWTLTESKRSSVAASLLSETVAQAQNWLKSQFQAFRFSGFDNSDGLDLWVFSMLPDSWSMNITDHLEKVLRFRLLDDPSVPARAAKIKETFVVSRRVEVCWHLMPNIADWVEDVELMGKYTITGDRYARTALDGLQYLFQCVGRTDPETSFAFPTQPSDVYKMASPALLQRAAPRKDLYLNALRIKPVVVAHMKRIYHGISAPENFEDAVDKYLEKTRSAIPDLNNKMSDAEQCQLQKTASESSAAVPLLSSYREAARANTPEMRFAHRKSVRQLQAQVSTRQTATVLLAPSRSWPQDEVESGLAVTVPGRAPTPENVKSSHFSFRGWANELNPFVRRKNKRRP